MASQDPDGHLGPVRMMGRLAWSTVAVWARRRVGRAYRNVAERSLASGSAWPARPAGSSVQRFGLRDPRSGALGRVEDALLQPEVVTVEDVTGDLLV